MSNRRHSNKCRKIQLRKILKFKSVCSNINMDLSKVSNDKKLYLCRSYFRIGFFLLPFVWFVNVVWFYNEAYRKPHFEEQKYLRKYVVYSAIGTSVWLIGIVTWIIVFQINRTNWGELADYISFIIPVGTP